MAGERHSREGDLDYDAEGRKVIELAKLNLASDHLETGIGRYDALNMIYKHPTSGGKVFVGNQTAAKTKSILEEAGVTYIVNCQSADSQNYLERDPTYVYHRFPIAWWQMSPTFKKRGIVAFFAEYVAFIEGAIAAGKSVMIHCLAGAHRAGTAGVVWLMHVADLDKAAAIKLAKQLRPAINPIGQLITLLSRFDEHTKKQRALGKPP